MRPQEEARPSGFGNFDEALAAVGLERDTVENLPWLGAWGNPRPRRLAATRLEVGRTKCESRRCGMPTRLGENSDPCT